MLNDFKLWRQEWLAGSGSNPWEIRVGKREADRGEKAALSDIKEAELRDLVIDWMWNEKERGSQEETQISALSKQVARAPHTV